MWLEIKCFVETFRIISKFARDNDIVARVGGDEFAILLPKTRKREAGVIADTILQAFQEYKTNILKHTLKLSISLGYARQKQLSSNLSHISQNWRKTICIDISL